LGRENIGEEKFGPLANPPLPPASYDYATNSNGSYRGEYMNPYITKIL
jgi:hypothetical protein